MRAATRLDQLVRENFDFAAMARFCAFRMQTPEMAREIHNFANGAFLEAALFQAAAEKAMEA